MTVLNFGGTGFIGGRVTDQLAANGEDVVCVDISLDKSSDRKNVRVVEGDITNEAVVTDLFETYEPERVLNFAYILGAEAEEKPGLAASVNCVGMDNIFRTATEFDVNRLVYMSSMSVYGTAGTHEPPITEDVTPPAAYTDYPWLLYAATKQLNEYQARLYADTFGLNVATVRPSIVFGPGRDSGLTKWASNFASLPARGEPTTLPFPPDQKLDMVYYEDVADLTYEVLTAESLSHRSYNTGGHSITARELADRVEALFDIPVACDPDAAPSKLIPDVSHGRAMAEFGFRLTPLNESLREHGSRARD